MEFIDIHCHVYPDAIAQKAADNIRSFYQIGDDMDGTPEMLLQRGKEAGIGRFVILPVAVKPEHVRSINDFAAKQGQLHREFIPFGTVHPAMENMAGEVDRLESLGLRGIKLHPDCQKFDIDDPRLFPMYEAIAGKMPVFLHMGDKRYDYSHPARLRKVLELFPRLDAVAAHFGGYSMFETACRELKDKSCIMDVSSSLMFMAPGEAEHYINLYGAERMAFGTDYPVWDPVEEVQRFLSLNLTAQQQEQIAWKTAARFLNL
jgi:predicted TIM-barrel fold metal-dependent hydrolase